MASTVISVGVFDGAHAGHGALVREARALAEKAGQGARVLALVFDPHPKSALSGGAPARLTTFAQRERQLRSLGADEVVRLDPGSGVLDLEPGAFLDLLVERHGMVGIVEGEDFRFGKGRSAGVAELEGLARARGVTARVVAPVRVALSDGLEVTASSTMARWLLEHGRVGDACAVLGRAYEMEGVVVSGAKRGRLMGMPTANLESGSLAPSDGVYGGVAGLPDGSSWPAAISVGTNPTFDGVRRTVEAHVIGWEGALDEYGWMLRLGFTRYLREQARFDSAESLLWQMRRDVERALDSADAGLMRGVGA